MRAHNMKFTHAVLLMVLVGCGGSTAGIARRQFATAYRCPEDRVIVTLAPSKTSLPQDPPPEVTRASLRMGILERFGKMNGRPALLFDIHGCGHHAVYVCIEQDGLDPSNGDPVTLVSCDSDSDASPSKAFNAAASLLGPMLATATISIPRLGLVTTGRPGDGLAVVSVQAGGPAGGTLRVGDVIVGIDGVAGGDVLALQKALTLAMDRADAAAPLHFSVRRGQDVLSVALVPR